MAFASNYINNDSLKGLNEQERITQNVKHNRGIDALDQRLAVAERHIYSHGLQYICGQINYYLTNIMIREYYSNKERYDALNAEGKEVIDYLRSDEFYRDILHFRIFPLDSHMKDFFSECSSPPPRPAALAHGYSGIDIPDCAVMRAQDGCHYAVLEGRKVFLQGDETQAQTYWREITIEQLKDHPHCYLEEDGGFNIKKCDIVADIGAAEGFFCIPHIDKIKHAYIFEANDTWFELLKKTYEPFMDKVTLVKGFVGDGKEDISLDEYFKDKEKPTFFKIDVEGTEGSVLRSMGGMLKNPKLPLRIAVCTYHRQEDATYIETLLGDSFEKHYSKSYYWHMPCPVPPFLRRGIMRATKILG